MMASEIHQETFSRCIQMGTPYPEAGEGPGRVPHGVSYKPLPFLRATLR